MRENRKIEELILMFVTTATSALRKDPQLAGDAWKLELNVQIASFVRMLRDCLRTVHHVPPELTARLDMYTAKLTDGVAQQRASATAVSSNGNGSTIAPPSPYLSGNVADMPMSRTIGRLFGKTDAEVQKDINELKHYCTEKVERKPSR